MTPHPPFPVLLDSPLTSFIRRRRSNSFSRFEDIDGATTPNNQLQVMTTRVRERQIIMYQRCLFG